jgi:hypothetical protein
MDLSDKNHTSLHNCAGTFVDYTDCFLSTSMYPVGTTTNETILNTDNVTEYIEHTIADYLVKSVLPFLFVFGTFGNVTAFVVLVQMCRKGSTVLVYLVVLACVDLMALYVFSFRRWVLHVFGIDIWCTSCLTCRLTGVMTYFTDQMSAWMQVMFTITRVLAVCWPLRFRHHWTLKTNAIIITIICVALYLMNAHILVWMKRHLDVTAITSCIPGSDAYAVFYYHIWPWVNLTNSSILPACILTEGSVLIIRQVKQSQNHAGLGQRDSEAQFSSQQQKRIKKNESLTGILFAVNATFLCCTLPICVFKIGYGYWQKDANAHQLAVLKLAWTGSNILSCTDHAVNVLLYTLSGSQFRTELKYTLASFKRRFKCI